MPKRLTVEGQSYTFPDDTTTEELNEFLLTLESPTPETPAPSQHPHARTWERAKNFFTSLDSAITPESIAEPENFSAVGGALGGAGGGLVGGPFGAIGGAALGGAAGAGLRDAVYTHQGDKRAPEDFPSALENAAWDGTMQGFFQTAGGAVSPALRVTGEALERVAPRLVRSGLKLSAPDLQRRAIIENRTPDEVGARVTKHVIDNRLTNVDKATALEKNFGEKIDRTVARFEAANPGAALDFDTRAPKYLSDFLKRLEDGQLLPDRDMAGVQAVGPRIMDSPLSRPSSLSTSDIRPIEKVVQEALEIARLRPTPWMASKGAPKFETIRDEGLHQMTGPGGAFPDSALTPNRILRDDISPSEMLRRVRGKSFYDPDVSEGTIMGGKVIERAGRDSVKELIPETVPLLEQQGLSIDAIRALEKAALRDASADQLRMGAVNALAYGNPMVAGGLQLAKAGQLRLGIGAGTRGPQIKRASESWLVDPNTISNALRLMFGQHEGK